MSGWFGGSRLDIGYRLCGWGLKVRGGGLREVLSSWRLEGEVRRFGEGSRGSIFFRRYLGFRKVS